MSDNWTVQVSPKLPDGTLVNIRAEEPEQLMAALSWFEANAAIVAKTSAALTDAATAIGLSKMTAPGGVSVQPAPQSGWGTQGQAQPQSQGAPGPSCRHGAMQHKSGNNKQGKPYSGWFCPSNNRNDQCPAQWDEKR